ncbi:DEAD/DEAH box helicase [Actinomyces slackii]|uniref:Putative ATP-dependent helicase Lhr n=1 Tax=Actinomyces slackii TaxID=52774 RepID=A0A3S4U0V3_9ACTO|nr:DEAD/DEAH box helicase [Actinomyces slackii]VEG73728.1 putative ATP-dependent helicase Lhr [Actinomyces slackii]
MPIPPPGLLPGPPQAPTRDLTALLESIGARDGRLVHLERTPARQARHGDWPDWATPSLITAYQAIGITRPWTHQAQAAEALHRGHHTVIATGTGSGKSLAAWLPALSGILAAQAPPAPATSGSSTTGPSTGHRISAHGRRPTTLYLSPTKALAADQAAALDRLIAALDTTPAALSTPAPGAPEAGSTTVPTTGRPDPTQPTIRTGTCDGDTPLAERDWVRAHADVVLTNPDFLHFSLLPGHERWTRFLRSLRYIVIDECHAYRGILGAHVALVLRRLLRLVHRLRPDAPAPTVLCASATTAEPALTAARLIGVAPQEVVAITDDGAPAGERTLALWQPALRDPWALPLPAPAAASTDPTADHAPPADTGDPDADPAARRSALVEASELLVDLMSAGARALVFVRSRRSAEIVAEHARRTLGLSLPELADAVAAYRGGYLPEERRALETDLRSGRLRALATTSALELGIDVTGLDAVLIAGWPGTRVSLGQQAGRAGRAGSRGLAVLIASDNPLDAYLVHHPEAVFAAPEATVFDPANPYVLAPHLCAAASESPLRQEDLARFGLEDDSLLVELASRGALRRRPAGWFWNASLPGRAQDLTSLRGDGPPPVPVVDAATGEVIGTVDGAAADSTVHDGAVYVHQGRTYVVEELTADAALVHQRSAVGYRTRARSRSTVRILAERERQVWELPTDSPATAPATAPAASAPSTVPAASAGSATPAVPSTAPATSAGSPVAPPPGASTGGAPPGPAVAPAPATPDTPPASVTWSFGSVEVTSQVTGYVTLATPGMEVVSQHSLEMEEHTLPTAAVWWTIPLDACRAAGIGPDSLPGALHAAEHASISLLPLLATCDRWDIGGLSTDLHPQTMAPTVFVHDGHAGGAGFAERGFRAGRQWLEATLAVIEDCPCATGCPSCVQSPKCGNNNEPLDKAGAIALLRMILSTTCPAVASGR